MSKFKGSRGGKVRQEAESKIQRETGHQALKQQEAPTTDMTFLPSGLKSAGHNQRSTGPTQTVKPQPTPKEEVVPVPRGQKDDTVTVAASITLL
eukprot:gene8863-2931_t